MHVEALYFLAGTFNLLPGERHFAPEASVRMSAQRRYCVMMPMWYGPSQPELRQARMVCWYFTLPWLDASGLVSLMVSLLGSPGFG